MATAGCAALVFVALAGFRSIEGGAPSYRPPQPSGGQWLSEDYDPSEARINEPSVFMPNVGQSTEGSEQGKSIYRE